MGELGYDERTGGTYWKPDLPPCAVCGCRETFRDANGVLWCRDDLQHVAAKVWAPLGGHPVRGV